jgi:hypothetical protein
MRNLITKTKAAHLEETVRRCLSMGCGFSLLGLRYSLRKPSALDGVPDFSSHLV